MKQRNKQNSRPKNPKHWAKVPRFKVRSLTSDRKSLNMLTSKLCCWPIRWCHWSQQGFCVFFDHWVDVWDWTNQTKEAEQDTFKIKHEREHQRAQVDTITTKTLMKNPHKIIMNWMSQEMWIWIWRSGTVHSEHNDGMFLENFLWNKNREKCLIKWSLIQL